jgi:hypothetical protein
MLFFAHISYYRRHAQKFACLERTGMKYGAFGIGGLLRPAQHRVRDRSTAERESSPRLSRRIRMTVPKAAGPAAH